MDVTFSVPRESLDAIRAVPTGKLGGLVVGSTSTGVMWLGDAGITRKHAPSGEAS